METAMAWAVIVTAVSGAITAGAVVIQNILTMRHLAMGAPRVVMHRVREAKGSKPVYQFAVHADDADKWRIERVKAPGLVRRTPLGTVSFDYVDGLAYIEPEGEIASRSLAFSPPLASGFFAAASEIDRAIFKLSLRSRPNSTAVAVAILER